MTRKARMGRRSAAAPGSAASTFRLLTPQRSRTTPTAARQRPGDGPEITSDRYCSRPPAPWQTQAPPAGMPHATTTLQLPRNSRCRPCTSRTQTTTRQAATQPPQFSSRPWGPQRDATAATDSGMSPSWIIADAAFSVSGMSSTERHRARQQTLAGTSRRSLAGTRGTARSRCDSTPNTPTQQQRPRYWFLGVYCHSARPPSTAAARSAPLILHGPFFFPSSSHALCRRSRAAPSRLRMPSPSSVRVNGSGTAVGGAA